MVCSQQQILIVIEARTNVSIYRDPGKAVGNFYREHQRTFIILYKKPMYFAILGKNPDISKAELQLIQPTNISSPKKGVITFDTDQPELISTLGGLIKAWPVVREKDLPTILENIPIIGIKELANGKHLKNTIGIRRFKLVDFSHTDKEIKEKGKELINIGNGDYGVVEWYQNIALYETIDFDKPARSMHMWMMPAKLTHIMINIWLNNSWLVTHNSSLTIYDPFVWSGTTWFLANALWYDFIGSDINISYAQKNIERWKQNKLYQANHDLMIFKQDINQPWPHGQPEEMFGWKVPQLIVTEWRLWPIVTRDMSSKQIETIQQEVSGFYEWFIIQIHNLFFSKKEKPVIVFTIPVYPGKNYIESNLTSLTKDLKQRSLTSISEVYQRPNQNIGRKILIIR